MKIKKLLPSALLTTAVVAMRKMIDKRWEIYTGAIDPHRLSQIIGNGVRDILSFQFPFEKKQTHCFFKQIAPGIGKYNRREITRRCVFLQEGVGESLDNQHFFCSLLNEPLKRQLSIKSGKETKAQTPQRSRICIRYHDQLKQFFKEFVETI